MSAYHRLNELAAEIALIESTSCVLDWDQETFMPNKALDHRAKQLGYLSGKAHALRTCQTFLDTLSAAEDEVGSLDPIAKANLIEWRRTTNRSIKLPQSLVEDFSQASSRAKAAWASARQNSDFKVFAPNLDQLLDLTRQKADLWGYESEPYDALLDEFEPAARAASIATLFDTIRPQLAVLARAAVERSSQIPGDLLLGHYPIAAQQQLNREIAESIGFDFEAGRIDTTAHPFCTRLGSHDVRLTTRYDESDFTSSLFGVLHEAGHGMYEQGVPADDFGLPSGNAVSLGIHESQSRLWENHVGRSRAFWSKWLPRAKEIFPSLKVSLDDMVRAVNRAEFSFIRVEADEATYDLHISLRFSLERQLLNRQLQIKDLPAAWNEEFRELFGLRPPNDAQGCLQDIHWAMGAIGYFPTYTLGNLNAAQLFNASQSHHAIKAATDAANYAPLLGWLRQEVHRHGSTLTPDALMLQATGSTTDARWHLQHLNSRFLG
jgi:carboxypeptidase Taq